jgi:hypothetical protein
MSLFRQHEIEERWGRFTGETTDTTPVEIVGDVGDPELCRQVEGLRIFNKNAGTITAILKIGALEWTRVTLATQYAETVILNRDVFLRLLEGDTLTIELTASVTDATVHCHWKDVPLAS